MYNHPLNFGVYAEHVCLNFLCNFQRIFKKFFLSLSVNELDEHKKLEERLTKWAQNEYQRDGPQAIHPYQRILVKNLQSDKNFVWSRARICDILP